ncbi:hypothetical protein SAMN04489729_4066 [Amycolatopsis lurida]|nr:hypothetical protein SAMN04489729_4066 [Amycolatopsis lurida]
MGLLGHLSTKTARIAFSGLNAIRAGSERQRRTVRPTRWNSFRSE